ncbi:MAG: DUF4276 family protein [Ignavibacteria bacterium]
MRGLYVLGEGHTEEQFINDVLRRYFIDRGIIDVRCILMETSPGNKGGDVSYKRYRLNAEKLLSRQSDIIVTSLIDFFKLNTDFPRFDEAKLKFPNDKFRRVEFLDDAISTELNNRRFIPYIQLHEFEGLLFSSNIGFEFIPDIPQNNRAQLENAVTEQENPELLNDGSTSAPSKRLVRLIPGYEKALHGPIIADVVTINTMLERCKRFSKWIETLISRMKE